MAAMLAAGALLAGGGIAVAVVLSRSPAQELNGLCRIASNDEYAARVDRILADYDRIAADPNAAQSAAQDDAVATAHDAATNGFIPLFQMQACSIEEFDLAVPPDPAVFARGLRDVIYDPSIRGGIMAAPIDIEVAWYAELGVEGLLGGWATVARMDHEVGIRVTQRLLSLGLAHATNPDRDAVLESGEYADFVADKDRHLGYAYIYELIDLGSQSHDLVRYKPLRWLSDAYSGDYLSDDPGDWEVTDTGPRVYGWSVLAPLLRFGDFHEQFLTPVATTIIQFDLGRNGNWVIEGEEPVSFDAYDDDPTNAMDAVLEALRRNPVAAQAVFEATGDQRVQDLLDER